MPGLVGAASEKATGAAPKLRTGGSSSNGSGMTSETSSTSVKAAGASGDVHTIVCRVGRTAVICGGADGPVGKIGLITGGVSEALSVPSVRR
jgi:hypothetical protein